MQAVRIALAGAAVFALATPVLADDAMGGSSAKSYDFKAQNGSGETGTVSLAPTTDGKGTTVTISLTGAPADAQPAHIHPGSCAKLDPKPKYPLTNIVGGKSTTTVPVSLATLTGGGYAVNVHKSASDLATYVACADLGGGSMMMTKPAASAAP